MGEAPPQPVRVPRVQRKSRKPRQTDTDDAVDDVAESAVLRGAPPSVVGVLGLQRTAGNQAAVAVLHRRPQHDQAPSLQRAPTITVTGMDTDTSRPFPQATKLPSDVDFGFNAMDVAHRLVEAIDQSTPKLLTADDPGYVEGVTTVARRINFAVVHDQLQGLTAAQVREVEERYLDYEHRALQVDLLGRGANGIAPNLSVEQIMRLRALLAGTRADVGEGPEVAAEHQREADAYELRAILKGSPKGADVERVMTLLRRSPEEAEKFVRRYDGNWNLRADLLRLGFTDAVRAMLLLNGSSVAADAYDVVNHRVAIVEIDRQLAELDSPDIGVADVLIGLGSIGGGGGAAAVRRAGIAALKARRRTHVDAIEARVRLSAEEARSEAEAGGLDVLGVDEAVRGRVTTVLGGDDATVRSVGGTEAKLLDAIARIDASEQTAAELRKLEERGQLSTDVFAAALRTLRQQAATEIARIYPDAAADELSEQTRKLADSWFTHLRSTWDAATPKDGRTFDQLLDRGSQAEVDVKRGLFTASGQLADVDELVLALRGDRKDLETVKRVLRNKNREQIDELKRLYKIKTTTKDNPWGGSLDEDLIGFAPSRAGQQDTTESDDPKGKAQGTDRLLIEDYLQRPYAEGGREEVDYLVGRAEREHEYTIANRGATGWWRDHWGNEAQHLLNATLKEVHDQRDHWYALTGDGTNTAAMRSEEARILIQKMHYARATIRGDRAGYERATAELRATFQAVASFVLQAVLTAVLSPAATALFRGISAAAAATRYGIWLKNTAVSIASTVAANKSVYGNAYNREMLYADLRGGLSGAIGSAAVGRLVDPVASRLQARLGKEMAGEVIEGAKTFGGIQATSALEGDGLVSFDTFAREHFLGKVSDRITHATGKGLEHAGYGREPEGRQTTHEPAGPHDPHQPQHPPDAEPRRPGRDSDSDDVDVDLPTPVSMKLPPELDRPAHDAPVHDAPATKPAKKPRSCFVAGTLVLTTLGPRLIETIAVGDLVLATASDTGVTEPSPVTDVLTAGDQPTLRIELAGVVVECTAEHPFWVAGQGWLRAGDLRPGTRLRTAVGTEPPIERVSAGATAPVHNLTVAGPHTFHVTTSGLLVHNKADAATTLPPAVLEARNKLEQHVIGVRERAQRILDQANAIGDKIENRGDLILLAKQGVEDLHELQDRLLDATTLAELDGPHRKAVDQAEQDLHQLQVEINDVWVPTPTAAETAQIDAYTQGLGQLRAAMTANDAGGLAAANTVLDGIEAHAVDQHNQPGSPESRLLDHIHTLTRERGLMAEPSNTDRVGQHLPSDALNAANAMGGLRGRSYRDIELALGVPTRDPKSAPVGKDGHVRFVWTFADHSEIHVDVPGTENDSKWEVSRLPHAAITDPRGVHVSQEGIAVPANSAPAHLPIVRDATLDSRLFGGRRVAK